MLESDPQPELHQKLMGSILFWVETHPSFMEMHFLVFV